MKLSPSMKKLMVKEMEFAADRMKTAPTMAEKVFYFSAVYGAVGRVLNFEYEPELAFIHQTVQLAYNQVNARVLNLVAKQDVAIGMPEGLFERLQEGVEQLIALLQKGAPTYPALEYIAHVAFSTTGNGYFLYLRGMLEM
jgi:hypothetical protein